MIDNETFMCRINMLPQLQCRQPGSCYGVCEASLPGSLTIGFDAPLSMQEQAHCKGGFGKGMSVGTYAETSKHCSSNLQHMQAALN